MSFSTLREARSVIQLYQFRSSYRGKGNGINWPTYTRQTIISWLHPVKLDNTQFVDRFLHADDF